MQHKRRGENEGENCSMRRPRMREKALRYVTNETPVKLVVDRFFFHFKCHCCLQKKYELDTAKSSFSDMVLLSFKQG